MKTRSLPIVALLALLFAPTLAAAQSAVDPAARDALPEKLRQSGTLEIATSLQWPPFDFSGEDGAPDGLDIRLVKALAGKLGLAANFTDVKFPAIVPGVSTGRFDIGVDEIADTAERRKAAQFVRYYKGGLGLLVQQGAAGIDPNHLCGRSVALTQGSFQVSVAERLSTACAAAGEKPIAQIFFPDSADTYLAVANARADAFMTDRAVGIYIAKHNGKLSALEGIVNGTDNVSGIVVAKDNDALAGALKLALKSMIQDGSYQAVLSMYGVPESAVTAAEVDASTPPD
jgi:polar amino acid transport system substrate-binding protein